MPDAAPEPPVQLRIRQANINSSKSAQDSIINATKYDNYDMILIQEPWTNSLDKVPASHKWRVVYPSNYLDNTARLRAVTLVNARLSTNFWHQIDVPDTNDLVAIQLLGPYGTASIINIYITTRHTPTH